MKVALEETITGRSFNIEPMWAKFNRVWTDETITKDLQSCLSASKDFLFLASLGYPGGCGKNFNAKKKEDTQISTDQLTVDEKETLTYICGAVLRKII